MAESSVIPTYSLAVADLDADAHLDLVMTSAYDSTVIVFLGQGDGTFRSRTSFPTGRWPVSVAVADLDRDGKPDLVVANHGSYTVSVLRGTGDGTFLVKTDFAAGKGARSVAVADLNDDGVLDLAVANADTSTVSVFAGLGDGTFSAPKAFAVGKDPSSIAIADFNGDGHWDLAVANSDLLGERWSTVDRDYVSTVSILLGDGNGAFGTKTDVQTAGVPLCIAALDLNRDATPDLITAGWSTKPLAVLLGNGDGTFGAKTKLWTCGQGSISVALGDLNQDGKLDVVVPDVWSRTLTVLVGYDDGTFAPEICFPTEGAPIAAAIADLDEDGRPDIFIAQRDPDTVSVLLNGDLRLPAAPLPRTSYSVGLWPNPTHETTDIYWVVPRMGFPVDISLFDTAGRRVRKLLSDPDAAPGVHHIHWDVRDERGTRVRAGVYLVRVRVGVDVRLARLVVIP
jgi:hypothetical protein